MFSKTKLSFLMIASVLSVMTLGLTQSQQTTYAAECEDIKGEEEWGSESHGDNNPSEDKFNDMIFEDDKTTCEVAEAIDKMEAEGEIKEHEWDEFQETFVYQGTSEEVQECFEDRFDLPDDGEKHLAGYEIQKCATSDY